MTDAQPVGRGAMNFSEKAQGRHQDRLALVHVRQSTLRQVEQNQESTRLHTPWSSAPSSSAGRQREAGLGHPAYLLDAAARHGTELVDAMFHGHGCRRFQLSTSNRYNYARHGKTATIIPP